MEWESECKREGFDFWFRLSHHGMEEAIVFEQLGYGEIGW